MKILGFNIQREKRGTEANPTSQYPDAIVGVGGSVVSGDSTTFLDLLRNYGNHSATAISAYFRAVELISSSVASIPIQVKKQDTTGHGEYVPNHYLYDIINHNESHMSRFFMMKMLVQQVLTKGNGFIYLNRDKAGKVKSMRWLPAESVTIIYNQQTNQLAYKCNLVSKKQIEPVNMIHIRIFSDDGIIGRSVLSYASRSIELAQNTEDAASSFYKSGCSLAGIIKTKSVKTPQQKTDIKNSWKSNMGNGSIAILDGEMEYQAIQQTVADSKVIEARQFTVVDIARWFGINPVLLGDLSHTSYNSIEQAQTEFLIHTLNPFIQLIEDEFTSKIFVPSEKGYSINLDESAVLRPNAKEQATYLKTMVDGGIISINEARFTLGLPAKEGADDLIRPYTDINQNKVNTNTPTEENKDNNDE